MTSFIAAGGSGRSTSVIPAVPAASSVTTIAFIRDLPVSSSHLLADWAWLVRLCVLRTADRDHPARLVIAIGDSHTAESFPTASYASATQRPRARPRRDRRAPEAIIAWNARGRRLLLLSRRRLTLRPAQMTSVAWEGLI